MTGFPLGGFGFPKTRMGVATYSRGRKSTILRQFNTDKDALWGGGIRVPIGNRIARAAAALTWGTLNPEKPDEDTATLADCIPHSYEAYEAFSPDGAIPEPRGKTPQTSDMFVRAAKEQVGMFSLFFGKEHSQGRLEAISIPHQLFEAHREVSPLHSPISSWGAMSYRYISEVMDGNRRLRMMLPWIVRKTEYRRKAHSPCVHGRPRLESPTTWLMNHHTGYWKSITVPKMEGRISKSAWKAALRHPAKPLHAAGGGFPPPPNLPCGGESRGLPSRYPHPLR